MTAHTNGNIKLSFCSTIMNRRESLKQTLLANLEMIAHYNGIAELNLINFIKDKEGQKIHDWILNLGTRHHFNYFVCTEMNFWHASIAKNTSHMVASGSLLINLDCDNFISKNALDQLASFSSSQLSNTIYLGYTGTVERNYCPLRNKNLKVKYKFKSKKPFDGSFGLMGFPSHLYKKIGGYDEQLPPMGGQDKNLFLRAIAAKPEIMVVHIPSFHDPIQNTKNDGLINIGIPNYHWKKNERSAYKRTKYVLRKDLLQANIDKTIGLNVINGYAYECD